MDKDLHKLIWLFFPIAMLLTPYISRAVSDKAYTFMYLETGWVEVTTVIYLIIAIIFSVIFIKTHDFSKHAWFKWWMVLLILGCIYFAGEEISWGQHFFGWSTPETWSNINDQNETNLHNTSPIFDQIPRTLLSLAALIGGVLVPLFRMLTKKYPSKNSNAYWLWPTYVCLPAALFSLLVSWNEKIYEGLNIEIPNVLDIRAGEVKESLLALFIMLYVLSLWYRNRIVKTNQ